MIEIEMNSADALAQSRAWTKQSVEATRRRGREEAAKIRKNAATVGRLIPLLPTACNLRISGMYAWESPEVTFPRECLPALRKAIGRLHVEGRDLKDAEKRLIIVALSAEKFPGIRFCYERELIGETCCQIVEQTSTYRTLACNR